LQQVQAQVQALTDTGTDFLYIGDWGDNTVKRFNASSGNFIDNFVSSGSGGLDGPNGILFEENGNLLVSNQNVGLAIAGQILRYNGETGVFETALVNYIDKNAPFAPQGIILIDFNLYVADLGDVGRPGNVSSYNEHNGAFLGNLTQNVIQNTAYHPRGIVFGPDGNLYVSVRDLPGGLGGHVLRFNPDGSFKDVFIADDGDVGKLNRPDGLVFGPDGNLYITSFRADPSDTDSIRIYAGKTGEFLRKIDLYTVGQPRAYAQAILFGLNGHLFVPITNIGEVRRYNVADGSYDSFVKAGGVLITPEFLTFRTIDPKNLEYRSTPTITCDNPTDICHGMPLRYGNQLNASATNPTSGAVLPGTFYYNPDVGTVLREGQNQSLNVTFVPGDSTNYTPASKTVHINVNECPEKHGFFHQTEYSTFFPFQWG
jgi:hypothetical protein